MKCPNCGAPNTITPGAENTCEYCGSPLQIAKEEQPPKASTSPTPPQKMTPKGKGCLWFFIVVFLLIIGLSVLNGILSFTNEILNTQNQQVETVTADDEQVHVYAEERNVKAEDGKTTSKAESKKNKTESKASAKKNKSNKSTSKNTSKNTSKSTSKNTSKSTSSKSSITMGQKNALEKAKSYLSFTAFSYEGLISQLEYEKFTHQEAVYAAKHCGANWKEQAAKKAKTYLSFSSFSREGLIRQLEFEKFTHEQAVYGVEANGY